MRLKLITALVLLASPACADGGFYYTRVPPHWLLDKGPRVMEVPAYVPAPEQSSPSVAVPFHAETNEEAAARARQEAHLCRPVRLYTDEGLVLHRPVECR